MLFGSIFKSSSRVFGRIGYSTLTLGSNIDARPFCVTSFILSLQAGNKSRNSNYAQGAIYEGRCLNLLARAGTINNVKSGGPGDLGVDITATLPANTVITVPKLNRYITAPKPLSNSQIISRFTLKKPIDLVIQCKSGETKFSKIMEQIGACQLVHEERVAKYGNKANPMIFAVISNSIITSHAFKTFNKIKCPLVFLQAPKGESHESDLKVKVILANATAKNVFKLAGFDEFKD